MLDGIAMAADEAVTMSWRRRRLRERKSKCIGTDEQERKNHDLLDHLGGIGALTLVRV